jgi:hypothetical protein
MDATRLPKIMTHWNPEERTQGRPRRTWKDGIYTAMNERDLRMGEWNNRRQWNMEGVIRRFKTTQYIHNIMLYYKSDIFNFTDTYSSSSALEIILYYNILSHILLCKLCNICCYMLCCWLKWKVLKLYCSSHPFGSQSISQTQIKSHSCR